MLYSELETEKYTRDILSDNFENIQQDAIVSFGYFPTSTKDGHNLTVLEIVDILNKKGFKTAAFFSKEAKDTSSIVVQRYGIILPCLKADNIYSETYDVVKSLAEEGVMVRGFANPFYVYAPQGTLKDDKYILDKVKKAYEKGEKFNPYDWDAKNIQNKEPLKLFRGGQYGKDAFFVIMRGLVERNFVYATPKMSVAIRYAYESGDVYSDKKYKIGFIYEYNPSQNQQYYDAIVHKKKAVDGLADDACETSAFSHKNKLTNVYMLVKNGSEERIFKIPNMDKSQNWQPDKEWDIMLTMLMPRRQKNLLGIMEERFNKQVREQGTKIGSVKNAVSDFETGDLSNISAYDLLAGIYGTFVQRKNDISGEVICYTDVDLSRLGITKLPIDFGLVEIKGDLKIQGNPALKIKEIKSLPIVTGTVFLPSHINPEYLVGYRIFDEDTISRVKGQKFLPIVKKCRNKVSTIYKKAKHNLLTDLIKQKGKMDYFINVKKSLLRVVQNGTPVSRYNIPRQSNFQFNFFLSGRIVRLPFDLVNFPFIRERPIVI